MAVEVAVALDCGTHAVRVVAYEKGNPTPIMLGSEEFTAYYAQPGFVEIDANMISSISIRVLREAIRQLQASGKTPVCLGITNMRETAVSWQASTGKTIHGAIHWMSLQSQPQVDQWALDGTGEKIRRISGASNHTLYFGSKIRWLLDNSERAQDLAEAGDLRIGTLESWLIKELTPDSLHVSDVSNASRYQLMDLRELAWSAEVCEATGIPVDALPEIRPTSGFFGYTDPDVIGIEIPITGVIADQQASLFGHDSHTTGDVKATFGTSGVVCLNLGQNVRLVDGLVTSVAWSHPDGRGAVYEIEASAFHSGSTINWLSSRLVRTNPWATKIERSALDAPDRPYIIPSFSQLGAPRWPKKSGGAMTGLKLDTTPDDIIRAGFESMVFQTYDSLQAIGERPKTISVDGGGSISEYMCQTLANLTETDIVRPSNLEITSLGTAQTAVLGLGEELADWFSSDDADATVFRPENDDGYAVEGYHVWSSLVSRILS